MSSQWDGADGAQDGPTCPKCGEYLRNTTYCGPVCDACEAEAEAHEAAIAEQESKYGGDAEMEAALIADGEKLRQLTGEDHGPFFIPEVE